MRVRVIGAGFYGCHIAKVLLRKGYEVEVHEKEGHVFAGASGGIPARLHAGFHYPRSKATRDACHSHHKEFMAEYGDFTRNVPVNIYAIAASDSLVDYGQYVSSLRQESEFITVDKPSEYGLRNVEGAILTQERHVITDDVADHFTHYLGKAIHYGSVLTEETINDGTATIDCSFCSYEGMPNIDRYEPCMVLFLKGDTTKAVTIMDGPFGSVYPWNESKGLLSLSSAKWSPLSKQCRSWAEANDIIRNLDMTTIRRHVTGMVQDMAEFFPAIREEYEVCGFKLSIRAMPRSGSDARLVDVVRTNDRVLRVRAGKIDAVVHAANVVQEKLGL